MKRQLINFCGCSENSAYGKIYSTEYVHQKQRCENSKTNLHLKKKRKLSQKKRFIKTEVENNRTETMSVEKINDNKNKCFKNISEFK